MNLKSLSLLSAAGILMSYTVDVTAQCEVKYSINSNWGNGATLSVDVTNYGAPKTTWELAWNFSNAEKISQLWNGTHSQTGQSVRVKNAGWNGNINTNQSINFGFNISLPNGTGLTKPTEFLLNGTKCSGKASSSSSSNKSSSSSVKSSSSVGSSSSVRSSSSVISSSNVKSSSSTISSSSLKSSSSVFSSSSMRSSSSFSSSSSSVPPLANCTNEITYGPRLLRVLTRTEYSNSIRDLTGVNIVSDLPAGSLDLLLANTHINGFENNSQETINKFVQGNFSNLANRVAIKAAATNFAAVIDCTGLTGEQCAAKFTQENLTRIFRRPATAVEIQEYSSLFSGAATAAQINSALMLALSTALSSPQFLYRQETGTAVSDLHEPDAATSLPIDSDAYVLTQYELASFLAFTFTGSTPDSELLSAAKNNALMTDTAIEAEVDRLLSKPSARAHFGKFATHWLATENIAAGTSLVVRSPDFTPEIVKDFAQEETEYFNHLVLDQAGPFNSLLASNYSIINESLFNFYKLGSVNVNTNNFVKRTYPSSTRQGGLLTSGAFVASKSDTVSTNSKDIALAIRNRVLCQDVYDTTNQDAGALRDNPFWQVGFAYQNLDSGSRRWTQINGSNPDAAGVLTGITSATDGQTLAFANAEDLAQKLSNLDAARQCFVEHNFRVAFDTGTKNFDPTKPDATSLSAAEQSDYACEKDRLDYAMTSNGNSARAMLKRLGSLHAARYRKDRSQ